MKNFLLYFFSILTINFIPILASVLLKYERAILSLESIFIFLIFASNKKKLGWFASVFFVFSEMIYGFTQEYPLFNLRNIFEMLPFVRFANKNLIIFGLGFFIAFLGLCIFVGKILLKHRNSFSILIILVFMGIFSNVSKFNNFIENSTPKTKIFQQSIFGSVFYEMYYRWRTDGSEWATMNDNENFYPYKSLSAAEKIWGGNVNSKKVLFLIIESWGNPNEKAEYEAQTNILLSNKKIRNIKSGVVNFSGGTVAAELRELCNIAPISYAFSSVSKEYADNCLPKILNARGYRTFALHAAHSGMYARGSWYPTIGFEESYFLNNPLAEVDRCNSFPGFCDVSLIPHVLEEIKKHEKIFFYWITLNSHAPYDSRDLKNKDDSACAKINLKYGARCNQFLLIKDFFDNIGNALSKSEISDLDVILVGDHTPPFIEFLPDTKTNIGLLKEKKYNSNLEFSDGKVPYIYFHIP